MNRLVLISELDSKRTIYFQKACDTFCITPTIYGHISEYLTNYQNGDWVKIDPPSIRDYGIEALSVFIQNYQDDLHRLSRIPGISFLNHPDAILTALDKRRTKEVLMEQQLATPAMLPSSIQSYVALIAYMEQHSLLRVFVKPRYGSGAAGVCAFMWNPHLQEGILYTPLALQNHHCINTKQVHKTMDSTYNRQVIDFVFSLDALVEEWIPKPRTGHLVYDLRVVWQFGQIESIIPRGSHSPITNLHLNDMALELSGVAPDINWPQLHELCHRAVSSIRGLNCAGLDIVCNRQNCQIIEINSQGDLIYKDIYETNQIYQNQVKHFQTIHPACNQYQSETR